MAMGSGAVANGRSEPGLSTSRGVGLGEHTPRSIEDFARAVIWESEYSREAWRITRTGYSDQYIAFIESMIESDVSD